MTAVVFPGQGSQAVGMAADAFEASPLARELFAQADQELAASGLAKPLSELCFEGPEELLKETENAQPALLAASYVLYRVAQDKVGQPGCTAGHSLGEYTALVAAGALEFGAALRLVRRRGELMRDAGRAHPGTMAAVLNLDDEVVTRLCAEAEALVVPANYNAPGQVVISGSQEGVATVVAAAKAAGGRAVPLRVAGAFHSPLMDTAAEQMAQELEAVALAPAKWPVVQNISAAPTTDPDELRKGLATQITGSVRWTESVRTLQTLGAERLVECGPGTVLVGLAKRIAPELATASVSSWAQAAE